MKREREHSTFIIIIIQHISISITGGWEPGSLFGLSFLVFFFLLPYFSLLCAGFPPDSRNWFSFSSDVSETAR
jgi:hypothetical protein